MPVDPRLNSLVQFTQAAATGDSQSGVIGMLRQELADQSRRLAALERAATIQPGAGPPTQAARDGTPYIDTTNLRLYVRINSAWRYLGPFT